MGEGTFRSYQPDQPYLLPPRVDEWLPDDHLAYFMRDVVETLDLEAIYSSYQLSEGGRPPYEPRMMLALVLYAYSVGVYSSRKIEQACWESVAFRVLSADQHPDHATIASFRKRHLKELGLLFNQVLKLCQRAGLVKLGHVALDSTKVKANASKHKAMSYGRMLKSEQRLNDEIAALLKRAQREDEEEDARLGPGGKDEDLPEELKRRQTRLAKIREAKAALEAEAREKAEEEARRKGGDPGAAGGQGRAEVKPAEKAQRNFTDPQSRIMLDKSSNSFVQAYNCQAAVDGKAQVIVAAEVTQETNDSRQLHPMLEKIKAHTDGQLPRRLTADSGYYNGEHVQSHEMEVDLYIATEQFRHGERVPAPRGRIPSGLSKKQLMGRKVRSARGQRIYAKRKQIVEPVFGQIKETRGFRQFLLRGLENVWGEWQVVCTTHNLLKLFRSGWRLNEA